MEACWRNRSRTVFLLGRCAELVYQYCEAGVESNSCMEKMAIKIASLLVNRSIGLRSRGSQRVHEACVKSALTVWSRNIGSDKQPDGCST